MAGKFTVRFWNKKGVSLVFVVTVAIALVILSAALFSVASHSRNLTGRSVDDRQTYLAAKSAVEYAKAAAYSEAQGGSLQNFTVKRDGDGFKKDVWTAGTVPDGVNICATCVNKSGDVTVEAKVKDKNSQKYRLLNYTFKVSFSNGFSKFMIPGSKYNGESILNSGNVLNNTSDSDDKYPVLFKNTVHVNSSINNFKEPAIYFMNPQSLVFNASGSSVRFCTEFVYFNGDIFCSNLGTSLKLENGIDNSSLKNEGLAYFNHTNITLAGTKKTLDGFYYFTDGMDLLDFSSWNSALTKIEASHYDDFSDIIIPATLSYLQSHYNNILYGDKSDYGGIGWSQDGKMINLSGTQNEQGNSVYLYIGDIGNSNSEWGNGNTDPVIYQTDLIALHYKGGKNTPFIVPKSVTFQTNTFYMNAQAQDGPPQDDTNGNDVPTLKQKNSSSKFILLSPSGATGNTVTLILPHGLRVERTNGTSYTIGSPTDAATKDVGDYAYTVSTSTDLFEADESAFTLSGSGGSGGGGGGFTISQGAYKEP